MSATTRAGRSPTSDATSSLVAGAAGCAPVDSRAPITPAVSVVIVTYRSRQTIGRALGPLSDACAEGLAECIVVDNASDDGTADLVERDCPWAHLIRSGENLGYGRASNLGAESARGRYLLLLNPDATIPRESLLCLYRFLEENPAAGIAAPAVRIGTMLERARDFPNPWRLLRGAPGRLLPRREALRRIEPGGAPFRADWCSGAVLLVRRSLFDLVGGFDPRFFLYFEDVDLCLRISRVGGQVWAVGESHAEHDGAVSAGSIGVPMYRGCIAPHFFRSRALYFEKHYGRSVAVASEIADWGVSLARDAYRRVMLLDPDPELRVRLSQMRIAGFGLRSTPGVRSLPKPRSKVCRCVVLVDVEPDSRQPSRLEPPEWAGYGRTHELLRRWRPLLAAASGSAVRFSWFYRMDPQVEDTYGDAAWAVTSYPTIADDLRASGDSFGLHVHSFRWVADPAGWMTDCADQSWVEHSVRCAFRAFEAAFGQPCLSFRYGDRWMNNATMALLEELGVRMDLTLEPGFGPEPVVYPRESSAGVYADHRHLPASPYWPSLGDYRVPGPRRRDGLRIFPLTTAPSGRLRGRLRRLARQLVRPAQRQWPMYAALKLHHPPEVFRRVLRRSLRTAPAYVTVVMRTDDAIRVPNWLEENLRHLASHGGRFVFVTAEEMAEIAEREETAGG